MRENRSVCLLLCLAAVLTLLAGCGAAPAPTQPATTTPETTAFPTAEATEATTEATEPAVEYAPLALETPTEADHIHAATEKTGLYKSYQMIWFYYYVSRQTPCSIVLTENGFMSNVDDVSNMLTEEALNAKADAMAQGIVNYYLELSGYEPRQ